MNKCEIMNLCKEAIDSGKAVESYHFYYSVLNMLSGETGVEKSFPLKCCDYCTGIQPYVMTEELFGDDHVVTRNLVVGCENEKQCKTIYGMLKNDAK